MFKIEFYPLPLHPVIQTPVEYYCTTLFLVYVHVCFCKNENKKSIDGKKMKENFCFLSLFLFYAASIYLVSIG